MEWDETEQEAGGEENWLERARMRTEAEWRRRKRSKRKRFLRGGVVRRLSLAGWWEVEMVDVGLQAKSDNRQTRDKMDAATMAARTPSRL